MSIRKPGAHRVHAGLGSKTQEEEGENDREQDRAGFNHPGHSLTEAGKSKGTDLSLNKDGADKHGHGPDMGHDKVFETGPETDRVLHLIDHKKIGGQGHELPEHEEEKHIGHGNDSDHSGNKQDKAVVKPGKALVGVNLHIAIRVKRAQERDRSNQNEKERTQMIHPHRQTCPQ